MTWAATAIVGTNLVGSYMAGESAKSAARTSASAQERAARLSANAATFRPVGMTSRFGTSKFTYGDVGDGIERVTGAEYTLSPELQGIQNRLMGLTGGALDIAEAAPGYANQLFGLSRGLLPTDITRAPSQAAMDYASSLRALGGRLTPSALTPTGEEAANIARMRGLAGSILPTSYDPTQLSANLYAEQQALLEPTRAREAAQLGSSVFRGGRGGLQIAGTGQPEQFAVARAREEQNAALAAQSRQLARQQIQEDIGLGTGLFNQALAQEIAGGERLRGQAIQALGLSGQALDAQTQAEMLARSRFAEDLGMSQNLYGAGTGVSTQALAPLQSYLGMIGSVEELGQQPLQLGLNIGGMAQQGASTAANLLGQGYANAATTRLQGNLVGPSMMAQGFSNFSNQYLQNQQQQAMFNRLYNPYTQAGYNPWAGSFSNPYTASAGVNFTAPGVYG